VLAGRLGYALRFARKDRVCAPVLEHIVSALKLLKESPTSVAASGDGDPWWNGSDPWARAADDGTNCLEDGTSKLLERKQHLEGHASAMYGLDSVRISPAFNPDAPAFTPFLQLPTFVPTVSDASKNLQDEIHALTNTVLALEKKVDSLQLNSPGVKEECDDEAKSDTVQDFESKLLACDGELQGKMREIEESVISEFRKYDEQLFELTEKLDGAEGLFREIHITESRLMAYSDRWWKAERISQGEFEEVETRMVNAGAPEWAVVDAKFKWRQNTKMTQQYSCLANEVNKIWKCIRLDGHDLLDEP